MGIIGFQNTFLRVSNYQNTQSSDIKIKTCQKIKKKTQEKVKHYFDSPNNDKGIGGL